MVKNKSNFLLLFLLFMALLTAPFTEDVQGCSIAIAPILGAAMLSAGTGFANGVVNNIVNRSNQRFQADIAKELMDYQWKNFTSPSAQVKAYGQAGINPAVALGQGGAGQVSGPSVNMPTGVPASFDFGGIAQGVQALALAKQAGANTLKTQLESELLSKTMTDQINKVTLENNYTKEQTSLVQQQFAKLTGEINVLSREAEIKQIDLNKHEQLLNALIRNYADKHNLDNQQFNALKEQLPVILDKLKHEESILGVEETIQKDFAQTTKTLGVIGDGLNILKVLLKILK